jgi:hypothetical protein
MSVLTQEKILLIGDSDRQVHAALAQVLPQAEVSVVPTYFDAIAELAGASYSTVLASAAPIERRPEPAIRTLREIAGQSKLLLFGSPGLEPLARKMLDFGLDDYLLTPANPTELQQMFGSPPLRLAPTPPPEGTEAEVAPRTAGRMDVLSGLPLADIILDALLHRPCSWCTPPRLPRPRRCRKASRCFRTPRASTDEMPARCTWSSPATKMKPPAGTCWRSWRISSGNC